ERGTTYVGETELVAELHRVRVATVFAADAQFDARAALVALLDRDLHELAHAGLIDRGKRVGFADFQLRIRREEAARVVAAHPEAGLGEVVRAEAEELGGLRDFVGRKRATRSEEH